MHRVHHAPLSAQDYVAASPGHARPQRGLIMRPNAEDVTGYRAHVDAAVERLIER